MAVEINPKLLEWARETAGFTLDEAASKLFGDTLSATAVEKLRDLELGKKFPSQTQLRNFSKIYKRPILAFYLPEPPRIGSRGQDFRQSPNARTRRENALLDTLLRDIKARQETIREILIDDEEFHTRAYVGSITRKNSIEEVVEKIATALDFDHMSLQDRKGDPQQLFKSLRTKAENIGVFVLLLSDLGSHHSTIPSSVFRGFAIADNVAPFVVINAQEAKASMSFTLLHELAHIWLGQTGVSGQVSSDLGSSEYSEVERFCNDVAGEFLLPRNRVLSFVQNFQSADLNAAEESIETISKQWSVSGPMVAYRMFRWGKIDVATYRSLCEIYARRWQNLRAKQKEKAKGKQGPNYNVLKQYKLGNAFLEVVYRNVRENSLTYTKAADLLGSKPSAVEKILSAYDSGRDQRNDFPPSIKAN